MLKLTEEQYHDYANSNYGVCAECHALNEGFHEPDAAGYECEECGENASMGLEEGIFSDLIEIIEDD